MSDVIKVLAVDDVEANLMIIRGCLKGDSFEVVTCTNAVDALQKFKEQYFDILLLDVIMPGIDGFELRKLIRASDPAEMQKLIAKADVLIEALPYIQAFHNAVVLVKFGGSAMEVPEVTRSVLKDIVFMASAGMKPIVVHGGGKAINAELARQEIPTKFVNGLRYTCDRTIRVVDDVLHNTVNAELVRILAEYGAEPAPVSGKNVLRGQRITTKDKETGEELDIGHVGKVVNVDTPQIQWLLERGRIPVIAPLACDMDGRVYNVNADMAACVIAAEMKVRKLVFLSDVPGVLRDPKDESSLISTIQIGDIPHMAEEGVISGGMIPKLNSAADAIRAGVGKVHMIDGRLRHSLLLEIFTDHGTGTQIVP